METLEKLRFDQFLVKEGKLIGKVGEREIELDQILSNGKGQTFVTFYEDGEKKRSCTLIVRATGTVECMANGSARRQMVW